jgi:type IV pilus assembly protein PilP
MTDLSKLLILFVTLILSGCQKDKDDLTAYIANIQAQPQPEIEPMPVMKTYEKFVYSAGELRDPFVKTVIDILPVEEEIIEELIDNGIHPDQSRLKEALEFYALNELQLVGTLQQENIWALVRAPEGVIHRVKIGDYMGLDDGQILTISDVEVTLKEIVSDERGGYVERDSSLSVVDVN